MVSAGEDRFNPAGIRCFVRVLKIGRELIFLIIRNIQTAMMKIALSILCVLAFAQVKGSDGCSNVTIISRAGWRARAPKSRLAISVPVGNFVIHHTAGGSCTTQAECIGLVRGIQNDHMDNRRYDDIGYSFLVGDDGNVYEGRGWENVGAHTQAHNNNKKSFGAAMIGNFNAKLPNTKALTAVKNLIACGVQLGKINTDYRLLGHRDVSGTECPGDRLYILIKTWPNFRYSPSG
ncbi:peptidoglycan-recognition protein SC2-like [Dreissena polymorpha]|uniref:Peptidoglycan-recognition protein n=1 Tax=Dreissena polymorpha TaxID=45954 RepID=A0A9D3YWQ1_DREPO|nr:peptidoglycan-recognition protein SC2-like [Dreissena polymorpha]KAH3706465.1 hypothetical protein DPMN_065851 [Dreissena polymorpha]